ncbi:FAD-dependent oxidoreductase domain-containing protein 1-like [Patiria miniata]|uniref:FAD-dependent oxidoreductase domain-containing protein 1 n=1 Tax=Patiria miniata TaxID=46514 RepID=A0A913Z1A9_PATMI|nr:FAD-dependent oxidoreductase domain-containing protein 1-like [Patiria miniata]
MSLPSLATVFARQLRSLAAASKMVHHRSSSSSNSGKFTDRFQKDLKTSFSLTDREGLDERNRPPHETDVLIIGGGVVGSSIAYHLKRDAEAGLNVTVVERDCMYTRASTTLSVGGIRQQFSIPANVEMSMYSVEFIKTIKEHLCVDDADPPDVQFNQGGYLILATEKGVDQMRENHKIQKECGAMVNLMTAKQLKSKFPWINTEGIALASYGYDNEGWFDPWSLLKAFKEKALSLGAQYIHGEVTGFDISKVPRAGAEMAYYTGSGRRVKTVKVRLPNSPETIPIKCSMVVIAAGPWSGEVAELLDIGKGSEEDLLHRCLPVCPRKRYVYMFHAPDGPGLDCPLFVDPVGFYCRREGFGGNYLCGRGPEGEEDEPNTDNLQVDYDFFETNIWPHLAHRVPAFENLKIKSAWAGFYDYNTLDQNAIIGNHPAYPNLYMATGFSGHGIQQSPAVGLAISDLILQGKFCTLDLSDFSFDRVMQNEPFKEKCIY